MQCRRVGKWGAEAAGDLPRPLAQLRRRAAVDRLLVVGGWVEDWSSQARTTAEQAIPIFEQVGDERGLARAWRLFGGVMGRAGQMAAGQDANERALEHAIRSGHERVQDAVIASETLFAAGIRP